MVLPPFIQRGHTWFVDCRETRLVMWLAIPIGDLSHSLWDGKKETDCHGVSDHLTFDDSPPPFLNNDELYCTKLASQRGVL